MISKKIEPDDKYIYVYASSMHSDKGSECVY